MTSNVRLRCEWNYPNEMECTRFSPIAVQKSLADVGRHGDGLDRFRAAVVDAHLHMMGVEQSRMPLAGQSSRNDQRRALDLGDELDGHKSLACAGGRGTMLPKCCTPSRAARASNW